MNGVPIKDNAREDFRALHDILRNNGSEDQMAKALDAVERPKIGFLIDTCNATYKGNRAETSIFVPAAGKGQ
jgi:hypothetical protein